jgi:hypothetical protein
MLPRCFFVAKMLQQILALAHEWRCNVTAFFYFGGLGFPKKLKRGNVATFSSYAKLRTSATGLFLGKKLARVFSYP